MKEIRYCKGKNKDKTNCQNRVKKGKNYCTTHREQDPNYWNQSTPAFDNGGYFESNGLNYGGGGAGGGTGDHVQASSP